MRVLTSMSKRRWLTLLGIVLCTAGVIGLLWAANVFGWRAWRLQEVEAFIGAPLPADAQDIYFATRSPYSRIVWLRFSLPASTDLTPFLAAMGIDESLTAGYTPFPAANPQETFMTWWQPQTAVEYAGFHWNGGRRVLEVLAEHKDSEVIVIYLRAYTPGHG